MLVVIRMYGGVSEEDVIVSSLVIAGITNMSLAHSELATHPDIRPVSTYKKMVKETAYDMYSTK